MLNRAYVQLTPRKRKAPAYPTPPPSASSSTTGCSPAKKRRGDQEVDESVVIDLAESSFGEPEYLEEKELDLQLDDLPWDPTEIPLDSIIPVRRITNFIISKHLGPVDAIELLGDLSNFDLHASGIVRAHYVEDGSEGSDDEDGHFVQGLKILEFDVHHIDADGEVNENMYIQTSRAFYILEKPSPTYEHLFNGLWIRHKFTHLILTSALANRRLTYDAFVDSLPYPLDESQLQSIEIIEYFRAFLSVCATDLKNTTTRNINSVPLVKTLQNRHFSKHLEIPQKAPDAETVVTPIVGRVIMPYLKRNTICVIGSDLAEPAQPLVDQTDGIVHEGNPARVRWGKSLRHHEDFDSVVIDQATYKIGDIVSVHPGEDEDKEFCINSYARRVWFIRIEYFFEAEDKHGDLTKKLHGTWLCHGSETILQQVSHSQELFLLEQCDDVDVNSILRKCNVRKLGPGEIAPLDRKDKNATTYFYKWVWDEIECKSSDLPSEEEEERARRQHTPCTNCGFDAEKASHRELRLIRNGFTKFGTDYHSNDFVYIRPVTASASPLPVAQIEDIELQGDAVICSVRYFERYPKESAGFNDNRRLYRSRHKNKVHAQDIDGICFVTFIRSGDVKSIEAWIKEDSHLDRFYVNEKLTASGNLVTLDEDDLEICHPCMDKYQQEMEELERYHGRDEPIRSLGVFSGIGGLAEGMRRAGIHNKWAIEKCPSAARTFATNHPETHVLETDANDVLRYIVEREEGKAPAALRTSGGSIIPDEAIPRSKQVDQAECGCPCQSFSGANHCKKEDDVRSTLPYTFLSYAEVLHPTYILIENVTGLLYHTLTGDDGKRVEMGTVKLIYQALLALGYQVCFKVLQAGQYGTPQDRQRVIFLAAKSGHTLPEHPTPTHAFPKAAYCFKVPVQGGQIRPPPRSREEIHLYAAHPAVTVNDAIGDLPAFDWVNPHGRINLTLHDVAERCRRKLEGIVQCHVYRSTPVGFSEPVAYGTGPQTRYQKAMRRSQDGLVEHHVTKAYNTLVVELTTLIPIRAWSNHRFLPSEILPPSLKMEKRAFYGRLDGSDHFRTAMTDPKPYAANSHFIHPAQKRTLSLREFARSQGFPDSYVLFSSKKTPAARLNDFFKQIGNAVPVPLATALGRSISAAAVHDWKERLRRERSPEL